MSKICENCSKEFPIWAEVDGRKRNFCSRKYCLDCSPFGSHNTVDLSRKTEDGKLICKHHGETDFCIEPSGRRRCKKCRTEAVTESRRRKKLRLVEEFGGQCFLCGYDKCVAALQFHHINPKDKEFGISSKACRAWNVLKKEADKCVLLCANCHFEVENGITHM